MRLIDADALIEWIDENVSENTPNALVTKAVVISALKSKNVAPTVDDTESIKHYAQGDGSYACNNCGETVGWEEMNCGGISLVKYKYCPECGRRMRWNG